jgi:hypothetical protein
LDIFKYQNLKELEIALAEVERIERSGYCGLLDADLWAVHNSLSGETLCRAGKVSRKAGI